MSESHDHEHHAQPNIKFLDRYVEKSWKTYLVLCGSHCFMFILFIILMFAVGESFFFMDTAVPLYNRNEKFQIRLDSVISAMDKADYDFNTPALQLQQSQAQLYRQPFFGLQLIYESKDNSDLCGGGNIWETLSLEEILEFEKYVESRPKYRNFCVREYDDYARSLEALTTGSNSSQIQTSIDTLRQYLDANENTFNCKPYHSALIPCQPNPDCRNVNSAPPGVIDCKVNHSEPCQIIDKSFVEAKVLEFGSLPIASLYNQSEEVQLFYSYTHKSFGGGTTAIPAIKSSFPFGLPLKGFDNTNDRLNDQYKEAATFLWDTYSDYLMKKNFKNINFYWDGEGMTDKYVEEGLNETIIFVACSFLGVWCYMSIMTKSCWKSTMGMGQILLSFFSTYTLYRCIFQMTYFGIFNVLSIFIILGIGADDIFVFLDTFSQAGVGIEYDEGVDEESNYKQQLSNAWRTASKAMLVTSLTTIISFSTNGSSKFPAVYTFGVFSAILVFVNYMSVILFYPSVVMVYERNFKHKNCCGPIGGCVMRVVHYIFGEEPPSRGKKEIGGIEKWFRDHYVPFVIKRKALIVFVSSIFLIVMINEARKLEADPNQPQMFPDDNNYQAFGVKNGNYFARGGGIYNIPVSMAFGIPRSDPIDRSGSVSTNTTDVGTVNWDPQWLEEGSDYGEQMTFISTLAPCVISICEKVDDPAQKMDNPDLLWLGGAEYRSNCMLRDFKEYVVNKHNATYWNTIVDGTPNSIKGFSEVFLEWFDGPPLELYKQYNYFEKVSDKIPVIRLFRNEIKLTHTLFVPFKNGIEVANNWDDWFNSELKKGSCQNVASVQNAFVYSHAFNYFFLQEELSREAYAGIAYSVIASFFVLSVFTYNWVVGLLATVTILCIIFCVMGFTVLNGWLLGVLESICFVMVPGMAVDFVAHLAESYIHSHKKDRIGRVTDMLVHTGVSVVSGGFSTIIACTFLMFPTITFFSKFGTFILMTILFSLYMALFFFSALLCFIGPQEDVGDLRPLYRSIHMICCGEGKKGEPKDTEMVTQSEKNAEPQTNAEPEKKAEPEPGKKAEPVPEKKAEPEPEEKVEIDTVNIITSQDDNVAT